MTTLYWYKTGVDAQWTTLTGNWWLDADHTQQAPNLPQNGDEVYFLGSTASFTSLLSNISLARVDTSNFSGTVIIVGAKITIQAGGTLKIGRVGGSHTWGGDASNAAISEFYGHSDVEESGKVGDNALFNDDSIARGVIGDNATFNDFSKVVKGTVGDNARFNDFSSISSASEIYSDVNLGSVVWNSEGVCHLHNYYGYTILNGDWTILKPFRLAGATSGTGRIIIPRREMDILIGTGDSKIVVGQAYGYGREG